MVLHIPAIEGKVKLRDTAGNKLSALLKLNGREKLSATVCAGSSRLQAWITRLQRDSGDDGINQIIPCRLSTLSPISSDKPEPSAGKSGGGAGHGPAQDG